MPLLRFFDGRDPAAALREDSLPELRAEPAGAQAIQNYRLVEVVGEGGMGVVFKAVDCNLNRHVALKVLKREMSADAEAQEKLEEEARVTASINHPHVVKVFSFR